VQGVREYKYHSLYRRPRLGNCMHGNQVQLVTSNDVEYKYPSVYRRPPLGSCMDIRCSWSEITSTIRCIGVHLMVAAWNSGAEDILTVFTVFFLIL
jgi:hypothetical protein